MKLNMAISFMRVKKKCSENLKNMMLFLKKILKDRN